MQTVEAIIKTADPDRYLTRLRDHATKMGTHRGHRPRRHGIGSLPPEIQHTEWSGASGTVTMNWGQWTVRGGQGMLTLRAEAADAVNLKRIQDMLTTRLENFGRRERLTVTWEAAQGAV